MDAKDYDDFLYELDVILNPATGMRLRSPCPAVLLDKVRLLNSSMNQIAEAVVAESQDPGEVVREVLGWAARATPKVESAFRVAGSYYLEKEDAELAVNLAGLSLEVCSIVRIGGIVYRLADASKQPIQLSDPTEMRDKVRLKALAKLSRLERKVLGLPESP